MAYRSSASAKSDTGGNLTATPSGVAANDYLGGYWSQDTNPGAPTYPSGWTQRANASLSSPDGQDVYYADKIAAGGDSFTFQTANTSENMLITAAWSGRDTTNPRTFAPAVTTNGSSNASPITAAATSGTAAAGDDVAVFFATDQTVGGDVWTFGTPTNASLTFTERVDDHTTNWTAMSFSTSDNVSAGAIGNITSTITRSSGSGNAGWRAIVISIAQASGGSTINSGAATSDGASSNTAVGASVASVPASSDGAATATAVGAAVSTADASSDGASTAITEGASISSANASSDGASTAIAVGTDGNSGATIVSADASSDGSSTAIAVGSRIVVDDDDEYRRRRVRDEEDMKIIAMAIAMALQEFKEAA